MDFGWESKYVNIPWTNRGRTMEGFDCYGQLRMVLLNEVGIELTPHTSINSLAVLQVNSLIEEARPEWVEVLYPKEFDVVLMGTTDMPYHVGVYIRDGMFLNTEKNKPSYVARVTDPAIKHKIHGYYRHRQLMGSFK